MFKFKLQPVLALKEKIEESKKKELGEASAFKEIKEQERHSLEVKKEYTYNKVMELQQGIMDLNYMRELSSYIIELDKQIAAKTIEVLEAEEEVERKRKELADAVKDRKTLDRLKEIDFENYMLEEKQEEQRIIDEIVTYKFREKSN